MKKVIITSTTMGGARAPSMSPHPPVTPRAQPRRRLIPTTTAALLLDGYKFLGEPM